MSIEHTPLHIIPVLWNAVTASIGSRKWKTCRFNVIWLTEMSPVSSLPGMKETMQQYVASQKSPTQLEAQLR